MHKNKTTNLVCHTVRKKVVRKDSFSCLLDFSGLLDSACVLQEVLLVRLISPAALARPTVTDLQVQQLWCVFGQPRGCVTLHGPARNWCLVRCCNSGFT